MRTAYSIRFKQPLGRIGLLHLGLKLLLVTQAVALIACAETATIPITAGSGAHPVLPHPVHALIPTLKIAPAVGWPKNAKPKAVEGTSVAAFALQLDHPR